MSNAYVLNPFTRRITDFNFQAVIVFSVRPVAVAALEFYLHSEGKVPKRHFLKGDTLKVISHTFI